MGKLVSVIIPAYNHQDFIKDCVKSVVSQTYKNLEIIIQDDCSTDNTVREIRKIKDKRIKLILSKKNQGIVDTLNDLIKLCNGDYVAVIGSDDVWYSTKIEKQIRIFEENPSLGCVFTAVDIIDENGMLYHDDCEFSDDFFKTDNMEQGKRIRTFYEKGNYLCHSSSIMPKKIIDEMGEYNKSYRQLHDYDYWVRVINKYNFYIIDEKLMGYRRIRNNKTSISSLSDKNMIRTINELYNIKYNMIMNLNDKMFREAFYDLFKNKFSKTKEELFCEKFFLLLDLNCGSVVNKQYALSLIFNYENKGKLFEVLNEKFHYTLNDFYEETGLISGVYPIIYNEEYNKVVNSYLNENKQLRDQVNEFVNSKSWKVTKPLRFVSSLFRKIRSKKDDKRE